MHQQHDIVDDSGKIEGRGLEFAFFDERTNPPDHFARTMVVLDQVLQYLAHFNKVDRLRRHEALGCLGVAQNRCERLIQLVC